MIRRPLLSLLVALPLAACDKGFDNVATCNDFLLTQSCGTTDFTALLDCEAFATEVVCDLQPYFDCLGDHGACDTTTDPTNPIFDDVGWAECRDLATCARDTDTLTGDTDAGGDTDGGDTDGGDTDGA